MRKYAIILLALLVFAACEKEEKHQYEVQRISSIEEFSADGSIRHLSTYTYLDDGYIIRKTVNGELESVSRLLWDEKVQIQTDSIVVDGVLQPNRTYIVYFRDINQSSADSVVVRNGAGDKIAVDKYTYDTNWYSIDTYEAGQPTTRKVFSSFYGTQSVENYAYDTEAKNWKYVNKEETITSYDYDLTTVTTYVDNVAKEKTIYQSLNGKVEFKRYEHDGASSWNLTGYGTYFYETLTLTLG
ncbi:MAG: hypothetical protein J5748_00270 [Bacteroidales bacterium]|nr:hypothetical protein [Bacteroidales bacterium]